MKKTIYLHVGPHKTGTTLLQKHFLDHSDTLAKNGVIYPRNYMAIFGHHKFRERLEKRTLNQQDIDFFHQSKHDFFISSEDFISLNKPDFEYLRDTLSAMNIVIIYSWRRASLKMYSIWQEIIKHGGSQTFYEYYYDHLAKPGQSQMLSADLKVKMFSDVFGKNNIQVLDYDASAKNKSLIADMLSLVGLPANLLPEPERSKASNVSLSSEDVELIRVLNSICEKKYGIFGSAVRECILRNYEGLMASHGSFLKEHIKSQMTSISVGNYFIDHRADAQMTHHFLDNIFNYEKSTIVKNITIPNTMWFLNEECYLKVNALAEEIKNKLI